MIVEWKYKCDLEPIGIDTCSSNWVIVVDDFNRLRFLNTNADLMFMIDYSEKRSFYLYYNEKYVAENENPWFFINQIVGETYIETDV
jgi:hypothetical protein